MAQRPQQVTQDLESMARVAFAAAPLSSNALAGTF